MLQFLFKNSCLQVSSLFFSVQVHFWVAVYSSLTNQGHFTCFFIRCIRLKYNLRRKNPFCWRQFISQYIHPLPSPTISCNIGLPSKLIYQLWPIDHNFSFLGYTLDRCLVLLLDGLLVALHTVCFLPKYISCFSDYH